VEEESVHVLVVVLFFVGQGSWRLLGLHVLEIGSLILLLLLRLALLGSRRLRGFSSLVLLVVSVVICVIVVVTVIVVMLVAVVMAVNMLVPMVMSVRAFSSMVVEVVEEKEANHVHEESEH